MRIVILISLSTFLLSCCGCGTQVPEELRNLYPVTVTVMNGKQPMAGVLVTLSAKGGQGAYACNGVTGNDGVALIRSTRGSYTGSGVPAGTYAVVLNETIELPADLEPQETDQDLPSAVLAKKERELAEFLSKNRSVPSTLTTAGASPIEVVVAKGQNAIVAVDISEHR